MAGHPPKGGAEGGDPPPSALFEALLSKLRGLLADIGFVGGFLLALSYAVEARRPDSPKPVEGPF